MTCAKMVRLIKNILINQFQKIINLTAKQLLWVVDYIKLNISYKYKKNICFNQLISELINLSKHMNLNVEIGLY